MTQKKKNIHSLFFLWVIPFHILPHYYYIMDNII